MSGKLLLFVLVLAAACLAPRPLSAQEDPANNGAATAQTPTGPISFQTFYDALANQGTWIQTGNYGYVWQPRVDDPAWAPYTDGHWVYTEAGWTWVSNEPWGWATYHYGRWVNLDGVGWCWVPGYIWGPAWVSWRYGDGFCGWAPLPPDSLAGIDYDDEDDYDGFHIGGDCDSYYGIGAGWYSFVPVGCLGEANYRGYYLNRYNNYRLINRTTNVTNINLNRNASAGGGPGATFGAVTLAGPSLVQVNAVSQTPISRVNLAFSDRVGPGALTGNTLALFAPRVGPATPEARPATVANTLARVNVNRGTDISQPLLVNSRLAATAPTPQQVEQARFAQANAPADAKVATIHMPVRSVSPQSFTVPPNASFNGIARSPVSGGTEYRTVTPGYSAPQTSSPSGNYRAPVGGGSYHAPAGGGNYHSGGYGGGGNGTVPGR
jgi:hypothetical protein